MFFLLFFNKRDQSNNINDDHIEWFSLLWKTLPYIIHSKIFNVFQKLSTVIIEYIIYDFLKV